MSRITLNDARRALAYLVKSRAQQGEPSLEVCVDQTRLDFPICSNDGTPLGQPLITIAVDRHSRMVVGIHISVGEPSAAAVATCLKQAITRAVKPRSPRR